MKTFEKIRIMRELNTWSQEDMANKLGLSTNGYAKIERGETRLNLPRLEQIAKIFEMDLMELLQNDNSGFIFQINDGDNNTDISFYATSTQELASEIEKLKLIIQHKDELLRSKDELLEQKNNENQLLRMLLAQQSNDAQ